MEALRLTSAQKRQIQKLDVHVERMSDADSAWFALRPTRDHRIRYSHPCEIAQLEVIDGEDRTPPEGWCWYTLVHQIIPGFRIRHTIDFLDGADIDDAVAEETARQLYEDHFETAVSREVDAKARALMAARQGGPRA